MPPERAAPAERTKKVTVPDAGVRVRAAGDGWLVEGDELKSIVARFDPENRKALAYLTSHFRRLGLSRALREAGAKTGDDVYLKGAVFELFDEEAPAEETTPEAESHGMDGVDAEDGPAGN